MHRSILLSATLLSAAIGALTFARAMAAPPQTGVNPPQAASTPQTRGTILLPKVKPIVITGEVVDAWCFSSQVMGSGRGEKHKACGLACAHGGVTLGIVDDNGTLYIAAKREFRGYKGCNELLTPLMAKRVKVVGWLATKGGCNVIKIKTVEESK